MERNTKIIILLITFFLIFFEGLFFGMLPNYIKSIKTNPSFMGYASSFTGGLFLSICLFHILPHSYEKYEKFPVSFILTFITFCFIFYIDKIKFNSNNHHNDLLEENLLAIQTEKTNKHKIKIEANFGETNLGENTYYKAINKSKTDTNFFLLFALAFHSIFEGISLGTSSDYKSLFTMLIGILSDKWAEGISLGITFVKKNVVFKKYLTMIIIFSIMTPIGILIGLFASLSENALIEAIFLGITSGTFIYISICEILIEEFILEEDDKNKSKKFLFFILGGVFVSLLTLYDCIFEEEN